MDRQIRNQKTKHESMQTPARSSAPRTNVPVEEDRPTQKISDYINEMQKNLNDLKLKLEEGTIGTYVPEVGKARLETCVMSCVATFVYGKQDRVSKKYELKLTCGVPAKNQQSSTNGRSVEMNYIQTDVPNGREHIPLLGTDLDVEAKTLAVVINDAKEAIDNKDLEKTVGNRGKDKVED